MLVTEKFAFIEMPRTGSTHTKFQLLDLLGGKRVGMHEPATPAVLSTHQVFLGTIRNPWDWYVSLWTIGCGRSGALHGTLTRSQYRISAGPAKGLLSDPAPWRKSYGNRDNRDVEAFRSWLRLLSTPDQVQRAMPRSFGISDIHQFAGFYTYRLARLFCTNGKQLHRPSALPDYESMDAFIDDHFYITHLVHTEDLNEELVAALLAIGVDLGPKQIEQIRFAPPRNRSHRTLPVEDYYDDDSLALIAERDRQIIERFGYTHPPWSSQGHGKQASTVNSPGSRGRWEKPVIA